MYSRGVSIITFLWVIVGAFVAGTHHYFEDVGTFRAIIAALLALFLWPLVLLHVNLHLGAS
ncbi:MAG TPA: hypothetical protein VKA30_02755 [Actinomycetota bacterium]|nr:hypothetical protein [Actinomycetota bacterium]